MKPGHLQRQYSKMANHCQSWGRASTACVQYLPARLKGSLTWPAVGHQRAKGDYFWMFAQNFFWFYRGQRKLVVFFVTQSVQRRRDALLIRRRSQFKCMFLKLRGPGSKNDGPVDTVKQLLLSLVIKSV